jgi:hypothetical protein
MYKLYSVALAGLALAVARPPRQTAIAPPVTTALPAPPLSSLRSPPPSSTLPRNRPARPSGVELAEFRDDGTLRE